MMLVPQTREKFATQIDSQILQAIRTLAHQEGRQIQSLMDEALTDLLEKRNSAKPRPHVMNAYRASLKKYEVLYKKLAE